MAANIMADIESLLTRWQAAGVVDAETAARIRAHEAGVPGKRIESAESESFPTSQSRDVGHPSAQVGLHWQGIAALIMGAILLACGVVLFVSAHWDEMGPGARFALVCAMVAVFHLAGGGVRESYRGLSTALHAVGTVATGAAIALVGQIFNIEEHWPGAVLLWALAALAGWLLLRDQAQETLALLLVPAWIFSEIGYRASGMIGADVYVGRLCFVWAILYLTFFVGSKQRVVQGILFAASAIAAGTGVGLMLTDWQSWNGTQGFLPFGLRVWAWIAIAGVPLVVAAFHGHKGLIPIAAAIAFVLALPWCYRGWTQSYPLGNGQTMTYRGSTPNVLAHALVAAFAVFVCWWGAKLVSRALVNIGVVGFAVAVVWFYFSDLMDKVGRSLGLIGLGVLFLAGGWALEKMRRRILARMELQVSEEVG
jgi:uncharacterized membrane protein